MLLKNNGKHMVILSMKSMEETSSNSIDTITRVVSNGLQAVNKASLAFYNAFKNNKKTKE